MARKTECTLTLECQLTDGEKINYSKELSDALIKIRGLENTLKSFQVQAKAEITCAEEQVSIYTQKISTGKEFREIKCSILYSFENLLKTIVRADTGEIVKVQPMTTDEAQEELKLHPPVEVAIEKTIEAIDKEKAATENNTLEFPPALGTEPCA